MKGTMTTDEKYRAIRNRLYKVIPETTDVDSNELARLLVELTTPGVELGDAEGAAPAKTRGQEVAEQFKAKEYDAERRFLVHEYQENAWTTFSAPTPANNAEQYLAALRVNIAALIDAERADAAKAALADKASVQASSGWSPEDVRKVLSVLEDLKKVVPAFVG